MTGSVADQLGRAAVVTACVQAANVWAGGNDSAGQRWQRVAELHGGVALAHLATTGRVLPLVEFVDGLTGSLAALLPEAMRQSCDEIPLLDGEELSAPASDLLRENLAPSVTAGQVAAWDWKLLSAEKVQGWLYGHLLATGSQQGYEAARLAMIRHAAGPLVSVNDLIKQVGLPRDGLYEPIPGWAWATRNGERYWFGCPICGWPMRFQLGRVSCAYPPHAQIMGAPRVKWQRSGPPRLGGWRRDRLPSLGVPRDIEVVARPVEDHVALVAPVWRYSTIPGCEEWYLARECDGLPGVTATLWPHTDAYDLRVEVEGRKQAWRVDVKDYTDPGRLAGVLSRKESLRAGDMMIVVPSYRAEQVGMLNERLREAFGQPRRRFAMTTTQFLARVRKVATAKERG